MLFSIAYNNRIVVVDDFKIAENNILVITRAHYQDTGESLTIWEITEMLLDMSGIHEVAV